MKRVRISMVLVFLLLVAWLAPIGASEWWNAAMTEATPPQSQALEAGPALYVRLENGQLHEGGGYLRPSGTWRLVMVHNPFVRVLACSQTPGPRYEIWEQKISFPGWRIFCFVKHYRFTTDTIGAWVDNGGGPKPLYLVYEKIVFSDIDTGERFFGPFQLLYHSGTDVNQDREIDILDLAIVAQYCSNEPEKYVEVGHPADVNGDTKIDRIDMEIVANLFGATPEVPAEEILPHIRESPPPAAPPLLTHRLNPIDKKVVAWARFRTEVRP